ncbi:hypothetical protein [Sphingomonas sp.]|uniref:hypothetical protein n=1 Tax=Sphingomonas sp. TaxID=28214 RepID=UPI001B07B934|nr:hypothetical protein [Sphingomonas sp.]MBO9711505.1 DsrE family protein [Sphingomonas sp.]
MPKLRGLTLVVVSGDPERFRAALTIACAHAVQGERTRFYCHEGAVALLRPGDHERDTLFRMARECGVEFIACQTGLAMADMAMPAGVEPGGLVGIFAELSDDRLVTV